jgi:hypothetical protein
MRTITALVFVLPVACMLRAMVVSYASFDLVTVWLVVSFACLAWGIYIRKRVRVLSWACIICALVQFALMLPFFFTPRYGGEG